MNRANRARHVLGVDHGRDVALGGALRDRTHVDARVAQSSEKAPRAARHAGHVVTHDGDDRAAVRDADTLYLPFAELDRERALDDHTYLLRRFLAHREADRVLGA